LPVWLLYSEVVLPVPTVAHRVQLVDSFGIAG